MRNIAHHIKNLDMVTVMSANHISIYYEMKCVFI